MTVTDTEESKSVQIRSDDSVCVVETNEVPVHSVSDRHSRSFDGDGGMTSYSAPNSLAASLEVTFVLHGNVIFLHNNWFASS